MATRSTMRTDARSRADQDASTFPTDTQYNVYLNSAGKEVFFDLIQAGWPVNFSNKDLTANGTAALAISPVGTLAFVRGVFRQEGQTWCELKRLNEGQRDSLMSTQGNLAEFYNVSYDLTLGPVLELLPTPSSGTYRVQYIVEWPGFSADGDVWPGPARSDELVVLRAAISGCRKEDNQQLSSALEQEYARLFDKVVNMASWFDMRNGPTIRQVSDPTGKLSGRDPFDYFAVGDY